MTALFDLLRIIGWAVLLVAVISLAAGAGYFAGAGEFRLPRWSPVEDPVAFVLVDVVLILLAGILVGVNKLVEQAREGG